MEYTSLLVPETAAVNLLTANQEQYGAVWC